jgi:hypothetical protein
MRFACFTSAVALVLIAGVASAADTMPNPEFTNWSKFKKGTSVTVKTTSTGGGAESETLSTSTLVEVGEDKVVVEYVSVSKVNGMEFKLPPAKREIPKTITVTKVDNTKADPKDPNKPVEVASEMGTETIKAVGTEFKTTWRKNKVEAGGTTSISKIWMSDDVPGMMVKMESTVTGVVNSTTRVELVEFKKP